MPVCIMLRYHGMKQADYDEVERELKRHDKPAPGELLSIVGPLEDGIQIVDIWESQAVFEAYMNERARPVLRRLGLQDPVVTVFPVTDWQVKG